jgi:hypothetical protein
MLKEVVVANLEYYPRNFPGENVYNYTKRYNAP